MITTNFTKQMLRCTSNVVRLAAVQEAVAALAYVHA